jgi:hypothetical protein
MVRNECSHKCFQAYRSPNPSDSRCEGGCGYCRSGMLFSQEPVGLDVINDVIAQQTEATWLFVLDFFESRNLDIFEAMGKQYKVPLTVEGCVRTFHQNYLDKVWDLKEKGVKEIWFGVESSSEELRNSYTKPHFTNEQLAEIMKRLKQADIDVCWYMTFGPEDTWQTVHDNNCFIDELKPKKAWYSCLVKHVAVA